MANYHHRTEVGSTRRGLKVDNPPEPPTTIEQTPPNKAVFYCQK